jgi:integrase
MSQAVPERYATLIYVLAYGGLRWGEAAALRRKRLNILRHRLEVVESLSDVDGHLQFGSTKTHQVRRIAIPQSLSRRLLEHLEAFVDRDRNALVFTSPEGEPLRLPNFRRRVWWPALDKVGMPRSVRIHDLRHTCASLLIAEGTHPKAVQQHLGHSSISVTLDRYGHLFPDEQDRLAQTLDRLMQPKRAHLSPSFVDDRKYIPFLGGSLLSPASESSFYDGTELPEENYWRSQPVPD